MNMNMVMVGRQLEQYKQERRKIRSKLRAMKKAAASGASQATGENPNKSSLRKEVTLSTKSSKGDDWIEDVRRELSSLLDGIPVSPSSSSEKEGGGGGGDKNTLGSLWSFWNVLDSILPNKSSSRRSKRSDETSACNMKNPRTTDYIWLAMTFIDFWMVTSEADERCWHYHICQLGKDNAWMTSMNPLMSIMDQVLRKGAATYLNHINSNITTSSLEAASRSHEDCLVFFRPQCVDEEHEGHEYTS